MYSLMSILIMAFSSSNKNSASARDNSVLPTPVGPKKRNEPIGRFGSCKPARAAHGGRDRFHRFALSDAAGADRFFHLQELLALAGEHLVDGDAGPTRDDGRDVFFGHLFLDELAATLRL